MSILKIDNGTHIEKYEYIDKDIDIEVHIMKKKLYFILTEIIIVLLSACSCSSGQKTENINGNTADNSLATASKEQPDVEEDDTETNNIETHDT